jgi:L-alanine-DL-glutamate epimerase-like enolase superfamily enzyme
VKIEQVRISRFSMDRLDASWRTASYSARAVDGFILRVDAGGFSGLGATAAHPNSISPEDLEVQLAGPIRDACMGADPLFRTTICAKANAARIHPRALIALDLALHDLIGNICDLPCHVFWGGALRARVKVVRMIGVKPPSELNAAVAALVTEGYKHFKIKIGTGVAEDVERIRQLRASIGSALWISVDANGAYTPAEAIELSHRLEDFNISSIEQPVNYKDVRGLAEVTRASAIPIMADQCVRDSASALAVCRSHAAHIVSIKLTSLGSIDECRQVYDICRAFGVRVHFGGSVTSVLVDVAQAQLAASLTDVDPECEVGEFMAVEGEPIVRPDIKDGELAIGSAAGWGVTLAGF